MKKKKKSIILFIILILILFITKFVNISNYRVSTKKQKELLGGLNTVTDVGQDIYVQHDNQNQDIYLLSSERGTTVYKILNVKYTAKKQWTQNGRYIDDFTDKNCATAPNDYISVQENEIYFVRLYGVRDLYTGSNGDLNEYTTPILFLDNNNNVIGDALSGTYANSTNGVEVTVPAGATRMHITNYNNQGISIQKKIVLNEQQFNEIKSGQTQILNSLDSNYLDVKNDPILYDSSDKSYVVFVLDDTREEMDKYADLFISKNVPLSLATISDNLSNMASNHTETRLDVALRVQEAGGEILTHNKTVITEENINDNEVLYKYFVSEKQKLTGMGFNVNGIMFADGSGQVVGSPLTAKWAYSLYKYSDLLGEQYNSKPNYASVYFGWRNGMGKYNNDASQIKEYIDNLIRLKRWDVFAFRKETEISIDTLSEVLDYINSKGKDTIEVVTYNTMYEKLAIRESEIIQREEEILNELYGEKTYYVSSNGTSTEGTDINAPMNLATLYTKKIKSGDTILFKCGDTFFGSLDLDINQTDDRKITISSYGSGDMPTICAYKYIGNAWEKYSDNIYRVDIKNTQNFTGLVYDNPYAFNVGFLEDDSGNKYYNKKISIEALENEYDFYSDNEQYLYMYTNTNPYTTLGKLKAPVRVKLLRLYSNMDISNIRFAYTGAHGISGNSSVVENVKISNCIIENIGGCYLYATNEVRYGNGIEFYERDARNIEISNNIIRNVYDVGFTIQGNAGSGTDVFVHDNVFVSNSQDSEIWESPPATGINNYQFYNNISINQARGWGYEARPDKKYSGAILFWEYHIEPTDIIFRDNIFYNPRKVYFIELTHGTVPFFRDNDYIKSDYNSYFMTSDAKIYDSLYEDSYTVEEKDAFITTYHKDEHSTFETIVPDQSIINIANSSNSINEIRLKFVQEDYLLNIEEPKWTFLPISQRRTLNTIFNPIEAVEGKTITWSSSNTNIATINSTTGEVIAKNAGTTVITAFDGEKNGIYTLNVSGILGDSDKDSQITSYDAYRALLLSINQGIEIQNNEDEVVSLDVDRNEEVTSWDAYRILIYSIGTINEF